jgi:histone deacetylase complex regulatory component SIN3
MSQYSGFEGLRSFDYNPGSHRPTPPAAYLTAPPAMSKNLTTAASYRSLEEALPSSSIPHAPVSQASAVGKDNAVALHERLLVVQDAIKWTIENQHKLFERMETILSNQSRAEKGLEALKASVVQLSKDFDDWKRKEGSEAGMDAYNECGDEGSQYTDAIVGDRYLRYE